MGLMPLWFAIMSFAIVKLVVEPAVEARSLQDAALKGLTLGVCAYSTLALPNAWSIQSYPSALTLEVILEGALFAPCAATFTTWWMLRREERV